jgi:hypothetical protein
MFHRRPAGRTPSRAALGLALVCALGAGSLTAQPPTIKDDLSRKDGDGPANPPADPITLPQDRAARQRLEAARDYLGQADWAQAVRLLQALLDAPEDSFLEAPDPRAGPGARWASARAEAGRLLDGLPDAGREFYRAAYDGPARRLLADARARGDVARLAEVARRYAHTAAGGEALTLLGTYHLDRGRPELAARYFRRLLRRSGKDGPPPEALFRAAVAFQQAGDRAGAEAVWKELAARSGGAGVRVGGRTFTPEQLRARAERLPAAEPAPALPTLFRADAARSGGGDADSPLLEPLWDIPTAEEGEARQWVRLAALAGPDGAPRLPSAVPVAAPGAVVFRACDGVHAVDARTGRELWARPSPLSLGAAVRDRDKGHLVQLRDWMRLYGPGQAPLAENSVLGTLSGDGRRVYAVEDLPFPPPPARLANPQQPDARPLLGPRGDAAFHNRLRALDLASGAVLWEAGGRGAAAGPLADAFFLGPPLPLAGELFAVVERKQELALVCLDPERGAVRWLQTLALTQAPLAQDPRRRVEALPLAYADGVLVCPTHAGAVMGVDPLERSLLWAHVYRDPPPPRPVGGPAALPAPEPAPQGRGGW